MNITSNSGFQTTYTTSTGTILSGTWVWSVTEGTSALTVTCQFGLGQSTANAVTASIPLGSSSPVAIGPGNGTDIYVSGSVMAVWIGPGSAYFVTFSGSMALSPGPNTACTPPYVMIVGVSVPAT
jgi:hypothetical protein